MARLMREEEVLRRYTPVVTHFSNWQNHLVAQGGACIARGRWWAGGEGDDDTAPAEKDCRPRRGKQQAGRNPFC